MKLFQRERRDATVEAMQQMAARRIQTSAGANVTDAVALSLPAVWGCVDLLAELVSTLPIGEYRKTNGARVNLESPPLLMDPAGDGTGIEVWLRQAMTSGLLRGNVYGLITSLGGNGWPNRIESLHPDRISWRRDTNFGPVESFLDNKRIDRWPYGPLWHMPAYVLPGSPIGMSPISYAAETIGLGIGANRYAAGWFNGGGLPIGTLESDQVLDSTIAEALKERIGQAIEPGKPLVLGAGLKFNPIQVNPQELQFLETIKANADDVARFFFRRPPGEGGQVTYANVEARSIDLLTYTLNGWLVRFEKSLTRLVPRPRYVKFNADALLRVDLKSRYEAHASAIRAGWLSRDDVRAIEDLEPIPDGSGGEYLWPPYSTTEGGAANDGPTQPARPGS